jgi:hypothetical protein
MPGRVYALKPAAGERDARQLGVRAFCYPSGSEIFGPALQIQRVELEADADEGYATITALIPDNAGNAIADLENDFVHEKFRTYVRIRKRDGSRLDGNGPSHDPSYATDSSDGKQFYWKILTPEQVAAAEDKSNG